METYYTTIETVDRRYQVSVTLHSLAEYEEAGGEYDDSGNGGEDMREARTELLAAMTLDESEPSLLPTDIGVPPQSAWYDSLTGYWLLREWPTSAPLAARCGVG